MRYRRSLVDGATYFFTVVTYKRRRILCNKENAGLIKEAFRYVQERHPFDVDAIVILPDHIHSIWTLPEKDSDFSTRWRMIKSYFTRRCRETYRKGRSPSRAEKGEQGVWQRRFWEHRIKEDEDLVRHVDYIHYNPVKHGLTTSPVEWPHTSLHSYVERGIYESDWGADSPIEFDAKVGHE